MHETYRILKYKEYDRTDRLNRWFSLLNMVSLRYLVLLP
jgi:hypothetical protein